MVRRKKLLILIPAQLLIPLLLGMISLSKAHKLGQGGPFGQSRQNCGCHNCPAHSLVSHNHCDAVPVDSISPNQGLPYSQETLCTAPEFFHSNIRFHSIPLRC